MFMGKFNMTLKGSQFFLLIVAASFTYCIADPGCPANPVQCKRCIQSCPKNETLVHSICGCCYDQCAPKEICPDPPIQCFVCHWSCPEGQTLKLSSCGCCHNQCVPDDPECPPDICQRVRCALPICPAGYILAKGEGYCGCCPACVKPKHGDKCYTDLNTDQPTCGCNLNCCDGICI